MMRTMVTRSPQRLTIDDGTIAAVVEDSLRTAAHVPPAFLPTINLGGVNLVGAAASGPPSPPPHLFRHHCCWCCRLVIQAKQDGQVCEREQDQELFQLCERLLLDQENYRQTHQCILHSIGASQEEHPSSSAWWVCHLSE